MCTMSNILLSKYLVLISHCFALFEHACIHLQSNTDAAIYCITANMSSGESMMRVCVSTAIASGRNMIFAYMRI